MDNIYLITGNSFYLMEEQIKNIVKDNIYETFDLNTTDINDILEEANYFSLFDEKKYIVVKSAEIFAADKRLRGNTKKVIEKIEKKPELIDNLTEEELETLEYYNNKYKSIKQYLDQPNSNTILIFSLYGTPSKTKDITKTIISKYKHIELPDLKPNDIKTRFIKYLKDNNYQVDDKIAQVVLRACKNNYDLVINEANKIMLYYGKPCKVNYEDVINITSIALEDNNFKFVDTILSKNIKESFKIYDDLMIQKIEPIMLLAMISKEIRNTLIVKQLLQTNSKKDIMNKLEIKYDFQLDKLINNTYQFSNQKLEELLLFICDNDYKIKTGKITNKLALQLLIIKICE